MSPLALSVVAILVMLGLIAIRMPVGLAMLLVGSAGYIHVVGLSPYLNYMKSTPWQVFSNYTLSVIPLFILMGAFTERAGLSTRLFRAGAAFVGHWRGGLAMATIAACTAFGAVCGSSVATTATFGRAALPQLRKYNYEAGFATGTVAVGGTLGILIPPSVILVIYAISTEQNIVKLFQAALIPGLMAAAFYVMVIWLVVRRRPEAGPALPKADWRERLSSLAGVWPVLVLAATVVGGIYGGVFTPTEGAAVGAVAALLLGVVQRSLSGRSIIEALLQTAETSAMIFLILLGAEVLNAFLAFTQLPTLVADTIRNAGLSPYAVMGVILVIYLILGALMDELAILLLTLPVFFPVIAALDFGMAPDDVAIWFGILVLITVGVGLTSPPIGLNVFVINTIARNVPMTATYRGVLPFIAADVIRLGIVLMFPGLALWLVRLLN